jgi:uncharacterized membrane protein (UPF0182 family)
VSTLPLSRPRLIRVWGLLLLFVLVVGMPALVDSYTDWLWFGETGYRQVFWRILTTQVGLGAVAAGLFFILLFANARLALGGRRSYEFTLRTAGGAQTIVTEAKALKFLVYGAVAFGALLMGMYAASRWDAWLLYRYATPFGKQDPILGRDAGFYVFQLPFLQFVQSALKIAVGLSLGVAAATYYTTGAISFRGWGVPWARPSAMRHVSALVAGLLIVLAFGAYLAIPTTLTEPSGIVHGASNSDVTARLPALRLLVGVTLVGAALALYQMFSRRLWPIPAALGLFVLASLGKEGYAALVQRFVVAPNEQVKETPYILHNIAATRAAFALADVEERELPGDVPLTREDIDRNASTLKNVPLWDHQPLLDTFAQIQEIRTYYDFVSVDNDRYRIGGEDRQVMLSARELNSASLPNRTWINERLTFTHGYGLTLGPVNQVTREGLPVLFIKNLPPESSIDDLQVTEPSLYFGELSSDPVFVRTRTKEFHHPRGDDNVTTTYTGDGGVPVKSFIRKLLFSIRFRSLKTLLTNDLTAESRVLFHRRISQRVKRIAPFLALDPDPYLAISGGRLFWILDAYTTSTRYPYSTPVAGGMNYIRNSVKVTIDAYHGRTLFYRIDPHDPVAATLAKAFPGLFRPLADMPEDLRSRLRYPQGIFSIQAAVLATYHMTNPATFYNKEDQWEAPAIDDLSGQPVRMQPYYTIMKLPGEAGAEFIQMLPFTPRQKDNLAAWLVGRSDGENYGKLVVFQFPKQKVVFGPRQVVARINQDQVISPQITLWNQQGSQVIQGTLLVIPIEESLLYIRPLYLRAAGGRITELKRVIVAHQSEIVMEETLEAALERLFPAGTARPEPVAAGEPPPVAAIGDAGGAVADLASQAQEHYRRAMQAQRDGNWALYGDEIKRLGEVLELIQRPR